MPDYKIYPGVDELFNFPPEVRRAMATSAEVAEQIAPAVSAALGENSTVVNAAANAVGEALEDSGVLAGAKDILVEGVAVSFTDSGGRRSFLETDESGAPSDHSTGLILDKIGPSLDQPLAELTGIQDIGDYSGWAWAVTDEDGYVGIGIRDDGTVFPELDKDGAEVFVPRGIHEWWIEPIAFWQNEPYPRLIHGAYDASGQVLVCEKPMHAPSNFVVVGKTGNIDDHNANSVFEAGTRLVTSWTEHNADRLIKFVVGDPDGSIKSLQANPIQSIDIGGVCSYSQVLKIEHMSDDDQTTYFVITRRATNFWSYLRVSINHDTGLLTTITSSTDLLSAGGQSYITMAESHEDGNQKVRMAWGYNPEHVNHAVFYIEVDLVTGAITRPGSSFTANLSGTNLPITYQSDAFILPEPETGWSRRLYYTRPGPYRRAISYADYQQGDWDGTAELKIVEWDGTNWVVRSYGSAGNKFSSTNGSYGGGPGFPNPAYNDKITYPRTVNGKNELVIRQTIRGVDTVKVIAESEAPLARAVFPKFTNPVGVLYVEVFDHQNAGQKFESILRSAKEL